MDNCSRVLEVQVMSGDRAPTEYRLKLRRDRTSSAKVISQWCGRCKHESECEALTMALLNDLPIKPGCDRFKIKGRNGFN